MEKKKIKPKKLMCLGKPAKVRCPSAEVGKGSYGKKGGSKGY